MFFITFASLIEQIEHHVLLLARLLDEGTESNVAKIYQGTKKKITRMVEFNIEQSINMEKNYR